MWRSSFSGLLLLAVIGCARVPTTDTRTAVDPDNQMTLFSIDGRCEEERGKVKAAETFHGYPVLGKVQITDSEQRKELMAALEDGIARRPKYGAKCFLPRHGLRVVEEGKVIEFVICFECDRFEVFENGKDVRHELINPDVQPKFDKPLKAAGIPIAPKADKDQ